jgi:aspartate/methionine/tyrosine aminotransferase
MSSLARQINALNLSQGIPEPINDANINDAVVHSLDTGWQYTPVQGDADLQAAIAREYDNIFAPRDEIVVTSGCTEALLIALLSARGRFGNTIAVLEPFYSYYPGLANLAGLGIETIPLRFAENAFTLDMGDVERALSRGTRILLLNTPHNPTGWVLDSRSAQELAGLVEKYDGLVVLDEVYRYFVYREDAEVRLYEYPALRGRCLVANAASKTFAATGMRVGWLAGPPDLMRGALTAHMHISNCQPLPLQRAVTRLFSVNDATWRRGVRDRYRKKRDLLLESLSRTGFRCAMPDGGHFVLADYTPLRAGIGSREFAVWFAHQAGVVALPVDDFYRWKAPTLVRFSFAVSMAIIDQVPCRLGQAVQ